MPISPQDYELYSRMTGRPMPRDPEEKMRMAPEVYDFSRNFGREPNVLQKAGNLVGNIGQGLMRSVQGGARLGYQELQDERNREFELEKEKIRAGARESKAEDMLRNFAEKERIKKENRMEMNEQVVEGKVRIKREEQEAKMKRDQKLADLKQAARESSGMGPMVDITDAVNIESNDFESPGEVLDQPIVNNQTGTNILGRVTKQGAELTQNPTVADSLTNRQTPEAVNLPNVDVSTDDQVFTTDVSNDPTGTKGFLKNSILNNSDLVDNPDVIGGEDDANVPGQKQNFDNTYLETDFSKSMENNERARAELRDIPSMKNPAFAPTDKRDRARSDFDMNDPEVRQEYAKLRSNKGLLGLKNEILEGMAIGNIAKQYQDARRREGTEGALDDIPVVTTSDKADNFVSSFQPKETVIYDREGQMSGKAVNIELNPTPQVGPIADGAGYARLMQGDPTAAFNVKGQGKIDGMKVEGVTKYTYPATSEIMSSMADTEGEDSLGRKKFNQLFTMAQKGEGGFGSKISQEFFPRII